MSFRHDHTCDGCGELLATDEERMSEWQAVVAGKSAWRGHQEHVEAEAAKWCIVQKADLRHVLDVYIENGMVDAEDEAIVNRLGEATNDTTAGSVG